MKQFRLPLLIVSMVFLFTASSTIEKRNEKLIIDNNKIEFIKPEITLKETTDIVRTLSSNSAEGRKPNTEGYDKAAKYVENYLLNYNLSPLFDNSFKSELSYSNVNGYNLVAKIGIFDKNRETVVLGAHLDHLGKAGTLIFNGANDNATGCTALMQIAMYLNSYDFDKNIIIAFFTQEETGMWGSKDLVRKLKGNGIRPSYMINFEMLGRPLLSSLKNEVNLTGFEMSNMAERMNEESDIDFVKKNYDEYKHAFFIRSDNISFYEEFKIPAHTVIAFNEKNDLNYHKATDTFDKIDVEFLNGVINKLSYSLAKLIASDEQITLNEKHRKYYNRNKPFKNR